MFIVVIQRHLIGFNLNLLTYSLPLLHATAVDSCRPSI